MKTNGTKDLRVQKTMAAIHQAFFDMMRKMKYDKITVTGLCARAKINKKTFYRYYPVLNDLLAEVQAEMSRGYIERIAAFRLPEDLEKINREFFYYAVEQGDLYEKILCSASYRFISEDMIGGFVCQAWNRSESFQQLNPYEQILLRGFLHHTGAELYRQWVKDGKQMPLEEVIALSNKLLCQGVEGFMKHCERPPRQDLDGENVIHGRRP